jgi:hypothetical protein
MMVAMNSMLIHSVYFGEINSRHDEDLSWMAGLKKPEVDSRPKTQVL